MKKNITINLFGQLYAIDEDACTLLEQYLDNMKRYFAKREGGDEIADDIEHRVAELFAELKSDGIEAISIEHVQDIIHRIGNPEEMDNEEIAEENDKNDNYSDHTDGAQDDSVSQASQSEKPASRGHRKLYRDPQDKMLGGVMSGLCHYFGSNDPLPWRILMIVLVFFSFSTVGIIYLIAWALIPPAVTAEQRLQMYGKPVNPQTLSEEVVRGAQRGAAYLGSSEFQNGAKGCLGTALTLFLFLLKIACLFVVGIGLIVLLAFGSLLGFGTFGGLGSLVKAGICESDFAGILQDFPGVTAMLWGIAISTLICGGIIIYALVRSFIRRPEDRPLSNGTRITLTIVAILCGATAITLTVLSSITIEHAENERERTENTRNGIYLCEYERDRLASDGWQVIAMENCDDEGEIFHTTKSFTDEDQFTDYMLFEREEEERPMTVHLERAEDHPAGMYHIEAIGFSKGLGAYVFARPDSGNVVAVNFPVDDTSGQGNMKDFTAQNLQDIDYFKNHASGSVSIKAPGVSVEVDDNGVEIEGLSVSYTRDRVKGWSFVRSESFYHKGGLITLGTTNIPNVVGKDGNVSGPYKYGLLDIRLVPDSAKGATNVKSNASSK